MESSSERDPQPNYGPQAGPKIDLFGGLEHHRCYQCFTPLNQFTKIITEVVPNLNVEGQTASPACVYCMPCFSGWSPEEFGAGQLKTRESSYYICSRTDLAERSLSNWSVDQIYWLLFFIEQHGPSIDPQFADIFNRKTGKQRTIEELTLRHQQLLESHFSPEQLTNQLTFMKVSEERESSDYTKRKVQVLERVEFEDEIQENNGHTFLNLINYGHLNEYQRSYPDNHADFISRIIATSASTSKLFGSRLSLNPLSETASQSDILKVLVNELQAKDEEQQCIEAFIGSFCQKYAKTEKRVRMQRIMEVNNQMTALWQMTHPELKELIKLEGIGEELKNIIEIKKSRHLLLKEVKNRKKANTKQPQRRGRRRRRAARGFRGRCEVISLSSSRNAEGASDSEGSQQSEYVNRLQQS